MLNKSLLILLLCSLSILASAYSPNLQKSYFSLKPNSTFSYDFPLTSKGVFAHYYDNSGLSKSQIFLLGLTNGDAFPVLEDTISSCQTASPIFQPIHYHVLTDTLVYYCAANNTLLIIDQGWQTVSASIPLGLGGAWPTAKLWSDGKNISVLAMDSLFSAFPKTSVLVNVDMQSRQVASQIFFNQNLTSGEAVVDYTTGPQGTYIATNKMDNNNVITKLYYLKFVGSTYTMFPLQDQYPLTSSKKTITKLFNLGNFVVINCDTTLYFLNNLGMFYRKDEVQTKELTPGIFHPAIVSGPEGSSSIYIHDSTLQAAQYSFYASGIFYNSYCQTQDMQIAHANTTSSDLLFSYDPSGVSFNIVDLQTRKFIRTVPASHADLMLTDTTYTVVQTNKTTTSFNIFNLKTDYLVMQVVVPLTKYYYNKAQHTITFITSSQSSSCQVTHLDLVSGKYWTTLSLSSSDACSSYVSYARISEKGNAELVIPGTQSYLIVSETYGQITFNTNSLTHETDSLNMNFDDMTFYYLNANQAALQVNASLYAFNPQTKSFEFKKYNYANLRPVQKNGFFTVSQNMTVALSDVSVSVFNTVNPLYYFAFVNNYNLATSFEDRDKVNYIFFAHFSADSQYSKPSTPALLDNLGRWIAISGQRTSTVSGQATSARSYALYDQLASSGISLVRFFNADFDGPNVTPRSRWSMRIDGIKI